MVKNLSLQLFKKNILNCYNVSPHGFYVVFMIFSKIIFVDFIFLILSWLKITTIVFLTKHCGLLQCFSTWVFFLLFLFFLFLFFYMIFFQNCLCCFYFFNIKLVENLALYFFFSLKHCRLLQSFPHIFFFCYKFFQNCLC